MPPRGFTTYSHNSGFLADFAQRIKESTIELRLELLDRSENSYFSVEYGGYSDHEWARGI